MKTPSDATSLPPLAPPSRREFLVQSAGALSAIAILPTLAAAAPVASRLSADPPLSVALIGAGRQGRAILAELAKMENVKVAAICDIDQTRRDNAAKRTAGSTAYETHAELLDKAKDVAAIIIATPTHEHAKIAIDSLAAGKHVYCEMPMAHTLADCRAIAQAAASAKTIFHAGLEGRSNPVYKLAWSFFQSDAARAFIAAEAQHFQKTSWRFPGSTPDREKAANWRLDPALSLGLIGELGIHQLDVVLWYANQTPSLITGRGSIRLHDDGRKVPDTIAAAFAFDSGAMFNYQASLANSYGGRFEVLRGSNAAIKLAWTHGWMFKESDAPTQGWEVYANRQQFFRDEGITLIAGATKLAEQGKLKEGVGLPHPSLYYSLWDFITAASTNKPSPCDAALGLRATSLVIAANQAITKREPVTIDPATLTL